MTPTILERIAAIGLMPVVADLAVEDSVHLATALKNGGIPAAEITYRMKNAGVVISKMREQCPEVLVGAGTVTNTNIAQDAIDSGAQFIVTPGFNPEVVHYCLDRMIEIIPGVSTASEIEQAVNLGLKAVKFFPAESIGGLSAIKALCGPYKGIGFMPTGGINLDNLPEYMRFSRIVACGGTFMLGNYAKTGQWDKVTNLCRQSIQKMLGLRLAHVGLNSEDEAAELTTNSLSDLLLLDKKEGNSSFFVSDSIEVMKSVGHGVNGHIGYKTLSIERTVKYFESIGVKFRIETAKRDTSGSLKAIYFQDEIGGFAIHLMQE